MTRLDGKRALVTAGAGGAGLAIARRLRDAGAAVAVCDIDADALASAEADGLAAVAADVALEADVMHLFDVVERRLGNVDILVNNVGIAGPTAPIEEVSLVDWERTISVNLTSAFLTIKRAVPPMKAAGGGSIVNISSGSAKVGLPLRTPYVVSKGAILNLTQTLARELGPAGIRVNAVLPGLIRGERVSRVINAKAAALGCSADELEARLLQYISLRTMVEPEDIAAAVHYLVSADGARVSGQMIGVDGHFEYEE